MIPLALMLIAAALADWITLLSRSAASRSRRLMINAVLAVGAAALSHAAYRSWDVTLLTLLTLSLGGAAWSGLRDDPGAGRGWFAIAALLAMLAAAALVIPVLVPDDPVEPPALLQHTAAYLERLPWYRGEHRDPERVLLILGLLLFLGPTANAVVRTVMTQIRSFDYAASEQQLKGGRYIGPLERWLIFGLALAGQPTAAALVISAKSLIRFPELQSKAGQTGAPDRPAENTASAPEQQIDELTEYFLIGSLLSWLLALLAALPIAATRAAG